MKQLLLILLLAPMVSANVVIYQVLYDPITTESGGEALELKNDGISAVDISGWIVSTESSAADATIPANTILQPGKTFLIADENWNASKDDPGWKAADYEEKITLGNTDSGVALLSNGTVIDAVGWGDSAGINSPLYEGTPAAMVGTGKVLLRTSDTDDNSEDFVEASADFQPGIPVPVTANVTITVPIIEISSSLNLAPEGILSIKNNGASSIDVKLVFNDLHFGDNTISKNAISVDTSLEFSVPAGVEHKSTVSLNIPLGTVPGSYTSTLRVVIT